MGTNLRARRAGAPSASTIVTVYDARTLRCAFPYSAAAVAKMQALPRRTYDGATRTWLLPVSDFDLLAAAFPDLQAAADAWEAAFPTAANRLAAALTFCRNLAALGVSIAEQDGKIEAVGDAASPLLQAEVAARADAIRQLLAQGHVFRAAARRAAGPDAAHWLAGVLDAEAADRAPLTGAGADAEPPNNCAPHAEPLPAAQGTQNAARGAPPADPLLAAVVRGMQNAAVRAAADAERRAAWRRAQMRRAAGEDGGSEREDGGPRQAALL